MIQYVLCWLDFDWCEEPASMWRWWQNLIPARWWLCHFEEMICSDTLSDPFAGFACMSYIFDAVFAITSKWALWTVARWWFCCRCCYTWWQNLIPARWWLCHFEEITRSDTLSEYCLANWSRYLLNRLLECIWLGPGQGRYNKRCYTSSERQSVEQTCKE